MKTNIDYFRIEMRYYWRVFVIRADKYFNLTRITVAGWLVKLGFWISPLLEYELSHGFTPTEHATNACKLLKPKDAVYNQTVPDYGDVMTRQDFACAVATNGFIDYDGFGIPAKNMDGVLRMANIHIYPSRANELPTDADFVVWFNR